MLDGKEEAGLMEIRIVGEEFDRRHVYTSIEGVLLAGNSYLSNNHNH